MSTYRVMANVLGVKVPSPTCDDLYAKRVEKKNPTVEGAKGAAVMGTVGGIVGAAVGTLVLSPEIGAPVGIAAGGWLGKWTGTEAAKDWNTQLDNLQANCPVRK